MCVEVVENLTGIKKKIIQITLINIFSSVHYINYWCFEVVIKKKKKINCTKSICFYISQKN